MLISNFNTKLEIPQSNFEGLPCPEDYSNDPSRAKLIIIDDLMRESSSSEAIVDLFIKGSHHKNLSNSHHAKSLSSGTTRYISQRELLCGFQKSMRSRANSSSRSTSLSQRSKVPRGSVSRRHVSTPTDIYCSI
ncbi:hypothetical protein P5V15_002685 [Pogonomyrmex californicus]